MALRTPAPDLSASEQVRAGQLRTGKRRAGGLLAVVTVGYVAATVAGPGRPWLAWVSATAVAAMVGGLADWFAVTALFRRPLGLPIPHTAIVVERKDRFGETLGSFVQESFLSPEAVIDRLRAARALPRFIEWLEQPENARSVSGRIVDTMVAGADLVGNEDVHDLFDGLVRPRLERIALAPAVGRALAQLTREQRHQPLVDAALTGLSRYLEHHGAELHERLGRRSPWWVPGPLEARMVTRLIDRSRAVLGDMATDRGHPLRIQIDSGLVSLARDLERSPDLRRRGEELKADLLAQPQVRRTAVALWEDAREYLRRQVEDPGSELRGRMAGIVSRGARRLGEDPDLAASGERALEGAIATTLGRFDAELARLVSGTIARWDAGETSRRLELLLGPDLQYIRINGTVVGGAAGLVLHAVSRLLG